MKLAVLFGGASFEHEISIVSAITIKSKLESFDLDFIFCDTDHKFYYIKDTKMKADTFSKKEYKKMPVLLLQEGGFLKQALLKKEVVSATVLNLIHGADGEDGVIASMLDFYKIPFIGPRTPACVFSFNKLYTKYFSQGLGIKSMPFEVLHKTDIRDVSTPLPFIIKPASLGSSIGVSIVKQQEELDYALDVAFEFDSCVIIEPFVKDIKEYNLAGCMIDNKIQYSIIEEPHKNEFLDFDKKYMDFSRSSTVLKAEIDSPLEVKIKDTFAKIYTHMFEGALIRCDFFVMGGEIYLNEINPIPGSMANYLFDDFSMVISGLAHSLPVKKQITCKYEYIHSLSSAKGK